MTETEHLLSSKKNAARLRKSIASFRHRSSVTGRFVTRLFALLFPRETQEEERK